MAVEAPCWLAAVLPVVERGVVMPSCSPPRLCAVQAGQGNVQSSKMQVRHSSSGEANGVGS